MAETEDNVDRELFRNFEKLRNLRIEHRDLDEVIMRLSLDVNTDELQMKPERTSGGGWKISIPMLPNGKYYYRFLIDDKMWMEDIENPLREPDGVTGWNSVLTV